MAGEATPEKAGKTGWGWKRWTAFAIGLLLALLIGAALLIDTPIGRRYITEQLKKQEFGNCMRVEIGRIDGSLYGGSTLHDVRLYDTKGVFFETPQVDLDWRPLAWVNDRLVIRDAVVTRGRLKAAPQFCETDTEGPILPDFDISIGKLEANDLVIEEGVAGQERRGNINISAEIRSGNAQVNALATTDGGDRVRVLADAVPEENRLDIELDVNAPADGVIAAIAGFDRGYRARIVGDGDWAAWDGALRIDSDETMLGAIKLAAKEGDVRILGQLYPETLLAGFPQRVLGGTVSIDGRGTLDARVLDGSIKLSSSALQFEGVGAIDLGNNLFDAFQIDAALRDQGLLGKGVAADDLKLNAVLNGEFSDLEADYRLSANSIAAGDFTVNAPVASGTARWNGTRATVPVRLSTRGISNGNDLIRRTLNGLAARGDIIWNNGRLSSDNLALVSDGMRADLELAGGARQGAYAVSGDVLLPAMTIENVGAANVRSNLRVLFGGGNPWKLDGKLAADMRRIENKTLVSIAGDDIRISTDYSFGAGLPLLLDNAVLRGSKIEARGKGRRLPDGNIEFTANGSHQEYGPFELAFEGKPDTARAKLLLENPLPSLGVQQVELALAPIEDGFEIDAKGGSALGPFAGVAQIFAQPEGKTLIRVDRLQVSRTTLRGDLIADGTAISGNIAANGGGIDGNIRISPQGEGQRIVAALTASNARFDGATPITVNRGKLDVTANLVTGRSDVDVSVDAQGIARGNLFIGRVTADAELSNGRGSVNASISGRRGSRFVLNTAANIVPRQVRFTASGKYGGRQISMPRNGVLTRLEDGGWRLSQSRINVGSGATVLSGQFGSGRTRAKFQMSDMSLSLLDIAMADLGLGGTASGIIEYKRESGQAPTGTAKLQIRKLTRSGLVVTSRPVDLALNAALGTDSLAMRGLIRNGDTTLGRIQARISDMPTSNDLQYRLRNGRLFGQVRYSGPADAVWRLIKVEAFDLTGKVDLAADATGTFENPRIRGSLSSENVRLESPLSGTVVENIKARGRFDGPVLTLTRIAGTTPGGGNVSGRGTIDLGVDTGVAINLDLQAENARVLARDDISATVTGPLTVRSDGQGGVLGGDVVINNAEFVLGSADAGKELPDIAYSEVNRRADEMPPRTAKVPWRYDITARARNQIDVRGLGIDSEWRADLELSGQVDTPRLNGVARLVRGEYEFAGRRFELERGQVTFFGASPADPRLDIEARADVQGLTATINVTGTGQQPEITFNSVPAMPEEELLARLLFGSSVADISAPEAVQLAAAVASLRSGGGLDPINQLRSAIGLDRLRIIGADAATGQGTSIAAGKYITRRTYVEVITDGRGYSATQVEFQITRWLSILSSISTIGRQSANVRISKDY